jgi:ATP-dependent DNA helicase RecQ
MTRAKSALTLFGITGLNNPHLTGIASSQPITWTLPDRADPPLAPAYLNREYRYLGPVDIFLDYAGRHPPSHGIHTSLSEISTGDPVFLKASFSGVNVCTAAGTPVAVLSRDAVAAWITELPRIHSASVLAILKRKRTDCDHDFQARLKCDAWEIPVLQITLEPVSNGQQKKNHTRAQLPFPSP